MRPAAWLYLGDWPAPAKHGSGASQRADRVGSGPKGATYGATLAQRAPGEATLGSSSCWPTHAASQLQRKRGASAGRSVGRTGSDGDPRRLLVLLILGWRDERSAGVGWAELEAEAEAGKKTSAAPRRAAAIPQHQKISRADSAKFVKQRSSRTEEYDESKTLSARIQECQVSRGVAPPLRWTDSTTRYKYQRRSWGGHSHSSRRGGHALLAR
jgi:hypothetical protein